MSLAMLDFMLVAVLIMHVIACIGELIYHMKES